MSPQNPLKYVNINQFTRVVVTQPKKRLHDLDKEGEESSTHGDKPGSQRGTDMKGWMDNTETSSPQTINSVLGRVTSPCEPFLEQQSPLQVQSHKFAKNLPQCLANSKCSTKVRKCAFSFSASSHP